MWLLTGIRIHWYYFRFDMCLKRSNPTYMAQSRRGLFRFVEVLTQDSHMSLLGIIFIHFLPFQSNSIHGIIE